MFVAASGSHLARFGRYQGQIGDCGGHEQLEQRLFPAQIA